MQNLALLLIGFSVFYAMILSLTHFRCKNYKEQAFAQVMGIVLILVLIGLQLSHYSYLQHDSSFIHSRYYSLLLFSVAPAFYLFSKPLLKAETGKSPWYFIHIVPLMVAVLLPHDISLPMAFFIGAGYVIWLAKSIYALRAQRDRFRIELLILATVFAIAVIVLILGMSLPLVSEYLFFTLYACAIGVAFLLVSLALSYAPQISNQVTDAARETYSVTTLGNVDCEASLSALKEMMQERKLYQENNLDLHTLAAELELSSHQLSELINTRLGKSFSRYIREQRIEAAKQMLHDQPSFSVLAVGLSVGFTSQSNFYDAFRDLVGTTPGKYRKQGKS